MEQTTLRKPHRTVVKGLKLLDEILKKVEKNNNFVNYPILEQQNDLPNDLFTYEILARLPVKCLLRLKAVSKTLQSNVSSDEFANVHFKTRLSDFHPCSAESPVECLFIQVGSKFYLFYIQEETVKLDYCLVKLEPNFESVEENDAQLVGSCNGLVCLGNSSSSAAAAAADYFYIWNPVTYQAAAADYFYIWNPVTYQSRRFSDPVLVSCPCDVSWGFGYVSATDDYKVVKIVQDYDLTETSIHVFSLRSQEWQRVQDHGLDQSLFLSKTNPGVFVNDSLYWIMVSRGPVEKRVVVRFSLTLEKFEEVPGLVLSGISPKDQFLCVTGGCLSMYNLNVRLEACLRIVKRPEEIETIRVPVLDKRACSGLVGSTKTGKCYVVSKGLDLALVDLNKSGKQCSPLVTFEQADRACVVSYVPSLISPFSI